MTAEELADEETGDDEDYDYVWNEPGGEDEEVEEEPEDEEEEPDLGAEDGEDGGAGNEDA